GRRVLDLGTGCGLVAIAAAKAGAARVVAADVDPIALSAVELNAAENGVNIEILRADLTESAPPPLDLVLAGDVFYDAGLAAKMRAFFERCRTADIPVLVGDPGRAFLPRARLELLAEYDGPDFAQTSGSNAVYAFR